MYSGYNGYSDNNCLAVDLLKQELGVGYRVFDAHVETASGTVDGIGYTDYSEGYTDGGTIKCFPAGFIALDDEIVSQEDKDSRIAIFDDDFGRDGCVYYYDLNMSPVSHHFVMDDCYVKYGVDGSNTFVIDEYYVKADNKHDFYKLLDTVDDDSIDGLYSYDEGDWIREPSFLESAIGGTSLTSKMDFGKLIQYVNSEIEKQDKNYLSMTVDTYVHLAEDAFNAYLSNMQQETFMGYRTSDLREAAASLEEGTFLVVGSDGLRISDIREIEQVSEFVRWLTGIVGTAVIIVCTMASAMSSGLLLPLAGAVTGAVAEIVQEVAMDGRNFADIRWDRVAVCAAVGSIAGFAGQMTSKVAAYAADTALWGVCDTAFAVADGQTFAQAIAGVTYGYGMGLLTAGIFKKSAHLDPDRLGFSVSRNGGKSGPAGYTPITDMPDVASGIKARNLAYKDILQKEYDLNNTNDKKLAPVKDWKDALDKGDAPLASHIQGVYVNKHDKHNLAIVLEDGSEMDIWLNGRGYGTSCILPENPPVSGPHFNVEDHGPLTHITFHPAKADGSAGDVHYHYRDGSNVMQRLDGTTYSLEYETNTRTFELNGETYAIMEKGNVKSVVKLDPVFANGQKMENHEPGLIKFRMKDLVKPKNIDLRDKLEELGLWDDVYTPSNGTVTVGSLLDSKNPSGGPVSA